MQLTPFGLSTPCSLSVTRSGRPMAPAMTSLAGALCTPRVESFRAHTPAMWPEGGSVMLGFGEPGVGSATSIHG